MLIPILFHAHFQNRNHLHISRIKVDYGAILDSQYHIKSEAVRDFSMLFSDDTTSRPDSLSPLLDYTPCLFTPSENSMLDRLPSLEEVREAVFSLGRDSALGPDGFFRTFFTHCWDIISKDVHQTVCDFFVDP